MAGPLRLASRLLALVAGLVAVLVSAAEIATPASVSPVASVPRCRAAQLRLAAGFYGVGLGSFTQSFTFTNGSRRACRLRGWPRLALAGRSGGAVAVPTRRVRQGDPATPATRLVVLGPGGAASFAVYGEDWDHARDRSCPETTAVLVTPPGAASALRAVVRMPSCGGLLIAPVIAGKTDREPWSVAVRG